jgi:hypothetical protein
MYASYSKTQRNNTNDRLTNMDHLLAGTTPAEGQVIEILSYPPWTPEREAAWRKRSNAAKRAVQTKRKKYTKWPTRRNDHKLRTPK